MPYLDDAKKANYYNHTLAPYMQSLFRMPCKIYVTEDSDDEVLKKLDQLSGIDAFQEVDGQMRGVALRVQYGNNWGTFTIRYSRASGQTTEFYKRVKALRENDGFLSPYFTAQVYINEETMGVIGGAFCKTEDLYDYILQNLEFLREKQCRICPEGNKFLWVRFTQIKESGYPIRFIPTQELIAA